MSKSAALKYDPWQEWWKENYPRRKVPKVWYKAFKGGERGREKRSPYGIMLDWKVGQWQVYPHTPYMCSYGLHVTTHPKPWASKWCCKPNPRVFVVDVRGMSDFTNEGHKAVCHAVKLLYEVDPKTLKRLRRKS